MSKMKVALMIKISGETAKKRLNMWDERILLSFPPYGALSYLRYGLQQAGCTLGGG